MEAARKRTAPVRPMRGLSLSVKLPGRTMREVAKSKVWAMARMAK